MTALKCRDCPQIQSGLVTSEAREKKARLSQSGSWHRKNSHCLRPTIDVRLASQSTPNPFLHFLVAQSSNFTLQNQTCLYAPLYSGFNYAWVRAVCDREPILRCDDQMKKKEQGLPVSMIPPPADSMNQRSTFEMELPCARSASWCYS